MTSTLQIAYGIRLSRNFLAFQTARMILDFQRLNQLPVGALRLRLLSSFRIKSPSCRLGENITIHTTFLSFHFAEKVLPVHFFKKEKTLSTKVRTKREQLRKYYKKIVWSRFWKKHFR